MELVEDKRHIKFISHPMPIFVHEETDELKTIDNSNKLSTKNIFYGKSVNNYNMLIH